MSKNLFDLSAEVTGASCILSGLSNQLDETESDILMPRALSDALFGVANYLDRIAADLEELSRRKDVPDKFGCCVSVNLRGIARESGGAA